MSCCHLPTILSPRVPKAPLRDQQQPHVLPPSSKCSLGPHLLRSGHTLWPRPLAPQSWIIIFWCDLYLLCLTNLFSPFIYYLSGLGISHYSQSLPQGAPWAWFWGYTVNTSNKALAFMALTLSGKATSNQVNTHSPLATCGFWACKTWLLWLMEGRQNFSLHLIILNLKANKQDTLSGLWWWLHGCIHVSKLIKLYTLSVCSLLIGQLYLNKVVLKK